MEEKNFYKRGRERKKKDGKRNKGARDNEN